MECRAQLLEALTFLEIPGVSYLCSEILCVVSSLVELFAIIVTSAHQLQIQSIDLLKSKSPSLSSLESKITLPVF